MSICTLTPGDRFFDIGYIIIFSGCGLLFITETPPPLPRTSWKGIVLLYSVMSAIGCLLSATGERRRGVGGGDEYHWSIDLYICV